MVTVVVTTILNILQLSHANAFNPAFLFRTVALLFGVFYSLRLELKESTIILIYNVSRLLFGKRCRSVGN